MTELPLPPDVRRRIEADPSLGENMPYPAAEPLRTDHPDLATQPEPGAILCCFCESEIPSPRNAWRGVTGFEQQRRDGGTNAIALRKPLDQYACNLCIDKQKAGVDPAQEALA